MIESLLLIFEKDRKDRTSLVDLWSNRFRRSLEKIKKRLNRSKKTSDLLEKNVLFVSFWQLFPLFTPKDRIAPFNLYSSIFDIDQLWSNRSRWSLKKIDRERIKSIFRSPKNRSNRSKNRCSNSQPLILQHNNTNRHCLFQRWARDNCFNIASDNDHWTTLQWHAKQISPLGVKMNFWYKIRGDRPQFFCMVLIKNRLTAQH